MVAAHTQRAPCDHVRRRPSTRSADPFFQRRRAQRLHRVFQRRAARRGVGLVASRAPGRRGPRVGSGAGGVPFALRPRGGVAPRAAGRLFGAHRQRGQTARRHDRPVLPDLRARQEAADHHVDQPHVRGHRLDDLSHRARPRQRAGGAAPLDDPGARRIVSRAAQCPLHPRAEPARKVRLASGPVAARALPCRVLAAAGVGGGQPAGGQRVRRHRLRRAGARLRRELVAPVHERGRFALCAAQAGAAAVPFRP